MFADLVFTYRSVDGSTQWLHFISEINYTLISIVLSSSKFG